MQLSKNFYLREFIRSATAIRHGIDNMPGPAEIANLEALAINVLQPVRDRYGKPIFIDSGFRAPRLNKLIKGAPNSQHIKGEAADLDTVTDNLEVFIIIRDQGNFDQIIWEYGDDMVPDWIHVSYKADGTNRRQVLRAYTTNEGKPRYVNI